MSSYILTEGVVSTAALYMLLKKIITPFDQWDAYKLGIIDKDGNKIKTPQTSAEREAWDLMSKFACNFKKIIIKFLGNSNFVSYFTMAYLLRDSLDMFYIEHNRTRLDETLLKDFTVSKQLQLFNIIQEVEKIYGKEKVTEDNVEVLLIKYTKIFESKVDVLKDLL